MVTTAIDDSAHSASIALAKAELFLPRGVLCSEMAKSASTALLACVLTLAVAGCSSNSSTTTSAAKPRTRTNTTFGWLVPALTPAGWHGLRISNGATLAYPPGWHAIKGDRGSATAVLLEGQGRDLGYLNLTPRQDPETLADWTAFRPHHNAEEGERDVTTEGAATGLRFRTGHGACVQDAYTTSTGRRYVEIACLVSGAHASSVIVGAALSGSWSAQRAVIERAISAMST